MAYRSRFLQVYEYQKQEEDKMAAMHAKLIVSDIKRLLLSSANLSYHGMQGNVEVGFLIESHDKAKQIEDVMKEMDHKTLAADGMEGRPQRAYEMCFKTSGGAALCDQCLSGQKTKRCGFAF